MFYFSSWKTVSVLFVLVWNNNKSGLYWFGAKTFFFAFVLVIILFGVKFKFYTLIKVTIYACADGGPDSSNSFPQPVKSRCSDSGGYI